jgi:amino acid adenylation domain-containing protein
VPIANRHHPGSEGLVGTLLNTLVLRADLSGDPQFSAVLEQVREACLDAYDHQDMPFEQLVQALGLPRDPSQAPLFGVMFNMLNTPLGTLEFAGLQWSRFEFDRHAAQFDLTVTVDADHDRSIVFEYATDLYEPATIARLADQYVRLLHQILDAPAARISTLSIISETDLARLEAWESGPVAPLEHETLPALLQPAFARHAHRRALSFGRETLDYRSLAAEAEALAQLLRVRGIGRGRYVGLCLQRAPRMLVALLAVLRAGGAWVPLDPTYPAERLAFMAEDAGLDLLITESALAGQIRWPDDATLLIDTVARLTGSSVAACDWDTSMDARPDDPAYLIYTSGSTGRPKGVVVPQRAVCNFMASMARRPGIGPGDRLLAVTTLGFDIAVLELLLPLTVGAQVVLAGQSAQTDGQQLRELLEQHAVTMMQATPSTWRMLIDAGWAGAPGFRALVGGESLVPDLAVALHERCAEAWNMYGPTETTIWSSCWRIDDSIREGQVSLGLPIDNTRIHILDGFGQRCPIGVAGELCIAGAGVASGYHQRPELDALQFVPDTFGSGPGERLYRTGDKACWLDDGRLRHMGRLDFQLKIRGHRIEPGEIEARLALHPALSGSVVIAREERPGDHRLVAYCLPRDKMPPPDLLREFLREQLPDYMVPQHFVELDAIPVLPNGKIDRSRLPSAAAHLVGDNAHVCAAKPTGAENLAALAGSPRGGALRH